MKLRQKIKKQKAKEKVKKMKKRFMLLDDALKKLVELKVAIVDNDKYKYSSRFERTAQEIIANPPSKLSQIKVAQEAGRKLIPQILALAVSKPSRRDIENMIVGYVCLKAYIKSYGIEIDKKLMPDLAYAVWYLNDHEPTVEEVEEWKLTLPE